MPSFVRYYCICKITIDKEVHAAPLDYDRDFFQTEVSRISCPDQCLLTTTIKMSKNLGPDILRNYDIHNIGVEDGLAFAVIFAIIAGVFILFEIWTIIVAKRARAEIHNEATGGNGTWSKA